MRRGGPWLVIPAAFVVLAIAIALRLALPSLIARYVNRTLEANPTYTGSIGEVDVALWEGKYGITDVKILKRGGKVPVPFFVGPRVDLSVEWRALLDGAFVGEVVFERPELNFVNGRSSASSQSGVGGRWRALVESLFPIRINRVEVRDGSIHFRDFDAKLPVDVYLKQVELVARNLTNSTDETTDRVARMRVTAVPMNQGRLRARASFDPLAKPPSFDFDGEVTDADLTEWSRLTRAYLGVDVESGTFAIYAELLSEAGRFKGYVKPFFRNVELLEFPGELTEQNPLRSVWEAVLGAIAGLLERPGSDSAATRIPIAGTVEDPDASFWVALGSAVSNAFVEALPERLEQSVGDG